MEDGSVPGIVVDLDRPRWRHQRPRKCQHLSTAAASGGLASRGTDRGIKRKTGRDQTVHAFLLLCDKTPPRVLRAGKSPPHPPNAQSRVRATRTAPAASAPCPWRAAPRPAGDSRGCKHRPPPPHTPPPCFQWNGTTPPHISVSSKIPHTPQQHAMRARAYLDYARVEPCWVDARHCASVPATGSVPADPPPTQTRKRVCAGGK